jgi:hypothetical protein
VRSGDREGSGVGTAKGQGWGLRRVRGGISVGLGVHWGALCDSSEICSSTLFSDEICGSDDGVCIDYDHFLGSTCVDEVFL